MRKFDVPINSFWKENLHLICGLKFITACSQVFAQTLVSLSIYIEILFCAILVTQAVFFMEECMTTCSYKLVQNFS